MEVKTTIEIKIQKFVMSYGAERLIVWLDHFDKVINSKEYPLFRDLERAACHACGISIADMRKFSNTPCTNSKRIISFVATHEFKLSVLSIATLLGLSDRAVNYYLRDSEEWLSQPNSNKQFVEAYNKVIQTLKLE